MLISQIFVFSKQIRLDLEKSCASQAYIEKKQNTLFIIKHAKRGL